MKKKILMVALIAVMLVSVLIAAGCDLLLSNCSDSRSNCNDKNSAFYCGDSGCDAYYKFTQNGKCDC